MGLSLLSHNIKKKCVYEEKFFFLSSLLLKIKKGRSEGRSFVFVSLLMVLKQGRRR